MNKTEPYLKREFKITSFNFGQSIINEEDLIIESSSKPQALSDICKYLFQKLKGIDIKLDDCVILIDLGGESETRYLRIETKEKNKI